MTIPPASAIADVLALWGLDGSLTPPLTPIVPAAGAVCGRARTVQIEFGDEGPALAPLYELLSSDLTGDVLVLAGAHVGAAAVWGEILASAAASNRATAVLVDGAVRDRPAVTALGLPLYAREERVVGPSGRAHVVAVDATVSVDTTDVAVHDMIVADPTGCVRVPAHLWSETLDGASRYAAAEEEVLRALQSGEPLTSAYRIKKFAVDDLRRRRTREVVSGQS